jgi:hypothetical protein
MIVHAVNERGTNHRRQVRHDAAERMISIDERSCQQAVDASSCEASGGAGARSESGHGKPACGEYPNVASAATRTTVLFSSSGRRVLFASTTRSALLTISACHRLLAPDRTTVTARVGVNSTAHLTTPSSSTLRTSPLDCAHPYARMARWEDDSRADRLKS